MSRGPVSAAVRSHQRDPKAVVIAEDQEAVGPQGAEAHVVGKGTRDGPSPAPPTKEGRLVTGERVEGQHPSQIPQGLNQAQGTTRWIYGRTTFPRFMGWVETGRNQPPHQSEQEEMVHRGNTPPTSSLCRLESPAAAEQGPGFELGHHARQLSDPTGVVLAEPGAVAHAAELFRQTRGVRFFAGVAGGEDQRTGGLPTETQVGEVVPIRRSGAGNQAMGAPKDQRKAPSPRLTRSRWDSQTWDGATP